MKNTRRVDIDQWNEASRRAMEQRLSSRGYGAMSRNCPPEVNRWREDPDSLSAEELIHVEHYAGPAKVFPGEPW